MSMRVTPLISYAHAQHLHDIVIPRHRLDRYDWLATCVRLVPPDKEKVKEEKQKQKTAWRQLRGRDGCELAVMHCFQRTTACPK